MIPFQFKSADAVSGAARVVEIPANIATKAELFTFLARAIPLPDYFGHNWDALEECLADLGEEDRPPLALVHQDVPLEKHPSDQGVYLEILAMAARDSGRLSVIFPEACREKIRAVLE